MASFHALNKKGLTLLDWIDYGKRDEHRFRPNGIFKLAFIPPSDME